MIKKLLYSIIPLLVSNGLIANNIDTLITKSDIKEVTVFFDGAQITRELNVKINKGKKVLKIEKLPAELNPESIQVSSNSGNKILSVKHQLDYPTKKKEKIKIYEDEIEIQEILIEEIKNKLIVYNTEKEIILNNSTFSNKVRGTSIDEIKLASEFYRSKLNEIDQEKMKLYLQLEKIKEIIKDLYIQLNKVNSEENKIFSSIEIVIENNQFTNSAFKVSYFVVSAGWTPFYDFRVEEINTPLNIIYNANIYQSTGEDWSNVNITLSTNQPSLNNIKPNLTKWDINKKQKYIAQEKFDGQATFKGMILEESNEEAIPFANITIEKDNNIIAGTSTDFDGNFQIKPIKPGTYTVKVSFIGYSTKVLKNVNFKSNQITFKTIYLEESNNELDAIMITEYSTPLISRDAGPSGAVLTKEDIKHLPTRDISKMVAQTAGIAQGENGNWSSRGGRSTSENIVYVDGMKVVGGLNLPKSTIQTSKVELISGIESSMNVTSLEYKIDIPYSIPTSGKNYTVKIKEIKLPVEYVYYAIPKLEKDAFLSVEIGQWEDLDLLSGISNIYYKGTFTGQSNIDINNTKDTLSLSLNRDKNIVIERILNKEKHKKQIIGKYIKETVSYNITIKNNKQLPINMILKDQFPISENKYITIEKIEYSGGKIEDKTGIIKWDIQLNANETKEIIIQYSVKYPNYMYVSTN